MKESDPGPVYYMIICRYIRICHWVRKGLQLNVLIITYGNNIPGELRKPYGKKDGVSDGKSDEVGISFLPGY